MTSPCLVGLPTECTIDILSQLVNWQSLHNLIRASPLHLRVYSQARAHILPVVIRSQINNDPLLIKIETLERYFHVTSDPQDAAIRDILLDPSPDPIDDMSINSAKHFIGLERAVDRHLHQFIQSRYDAIDQAARSKNLCVTMDRNTAPRPVECSRIRRALYRLQLLTYVERVLKHSPPPFTHGGPENRMLIPFLQRLPRHELEEFLCVYHHFIEQLHSHVVKAEENLIDVLLEDGPAEIDSDPQGVRSRFDCPYFHNGFGRGDHARWKEKTLSCGLRFVDALLTQSDSDNRPDLYGDTSPESIMMTKNVLNHLPSFESVIATVDNTELEKCRKLDETHNHANDGYLWLLQHSGPDIARSCRFRRSSFTHYETFRTCHCCAVRAGSSGFRPRRDEDLCMWSMRRWGFAIWDRQRLTESTILSQRLSTLVRAFHVDLESWLERPSCQERVAARIKGWRRQGFIRDKSWKVIQQWVDSEMTRLKWRLDEQKQKEKQKARVQWPSYKTPKPA